MRRPTRYDPATTSAARQRRLARAQGIVAMERQAREKGAAPSSREVLFGRLRAELDDRLARDDEPHGRIREARRIA